MTMLASRKFINYTFQKIVDVATHTTTGFVKYCPKITQGTNVRWNPKFNFGLLIVYWKASFETSATYYYFLYHLETT